MQSCHQLQNWSWQTFDLRKFWISSAWFEPQFEIFSWIWSFLARFTKYLGASATKPFQALWMFEYFIRHKDFSISPVVLNGPTILWTGQTRSSGQQVQKATFVDKVFAPNRERERKRLALISWSTINIFPFMLGIETKGCSIFVLMLVIYFRELIYSETIICKSLCAF